MSIQRILRIGSIAFLAVGLVCSVAMMLFVIGMEGMRHSRPGPSQFDSYYWSSVIPVVLWGYWLSSAFARLSKETFAFATLTAAALSIWWITMLGEEGLDIAGVAAASAAVSFLASWYARRVFPAANHESKTEPNQAPEPTARSGRGSS